MPAVGYAWDRNIEVFAVPTTERYIFGAALWQPIKPPEKIIRINIKINLFCSNLLFNIIFFLDLLKNGHIFLGLI